VLIAPAKVIESKSLKWVTHIGSTIIILNIFLFVFCSLYFGEKVVDFYCAGCTGIEKSLEEIALEKNLESTSLEEVGAVSVKCGLAASLSAATVKGTMEKLEIKKHTFKIPKVGSISSPTLVAVPVMIESVNQVIQMNNRMKGETFIRERTILDLKKKEVEEVEIHTLPHPGAPSDQNTGLLATVETPQGKEEEEEILEITSQEERTDLEIPPLEEVQTVMDSWEYLDILNSLPPL
jgi:hypothetical protein